MHITHRQLVNKTSTLLSTIQWLQEIKILPESKTCINCVNQPLRLVSYKKTYRWKCTKCSSACSIFENTIFFNTKLEITRLLDLVYFWSMDQNQTKVKHEIECNAQKTVCDWFKKLQKLSYIVMRDESSSKIGGTGHIVEIDESLFSKRKYNVGRVPRSPWVVGGIDLETKECFFVEVTHRNADTLKYIILEKVEPGSLIITDEWRGYWGLEELGYHHITVNHSENFICPLTGANTQLIENTWGWMKRKIRARGLKNNGDLTLIFAEFLFKKRYKDNAFYKILNCLCNSAERINF
ncbi:hypothetical protein H311_00129 [Anncaliia algerae PRA109]|nr:hypothetical protein H311_00129 [Anncaliia algerae PRA109]